MKPKTPAITADYKKLPDEELVYRYVHRHEHAALNYLFDRYGHLVLGLCMKYFDAPTAKEKTEAFFIQLTEDLKRFHMDNNFKLWLYNYINNRCVAETNKGVTTTDNTIKTDGTSFYNAEVTDEELKLIQEKVKTLNKMERECIELFYLNEMNYAEIAKEKKLTIAEVKQHIQSGLKTIKNKNEALKA